MNISELVRFSSTSSHPLKALKAGTFGEITAIETRDGQPFLNVTFDNVEVCGLHASNFEDAEGVALSIMQDGTISQQEQDEINSGAVYTPGFWDEVKRRLGL